MCSALESWPSGLQSRLDDHSLLITIENYCLYKVPIWIFGGFFRICPWQLRFSDTCCFLLTAHLRGDTQAWVLACTVCPAALRSCPFSPSMQENDSVTALWMVGCLLRQEAQFLPNILCLPLPPVFLELSRVISCILAVPGVQCVWLSCQAQYFSLGSLILVKKNGRPHCVTFC